jgi:uncharacterized protein
MARNNSSQGQMTVQEAGRKGGKTTARTHGRDFYQSIGRKGGQSRADDADVQSGSLGRKGGQATAKKHGRGFYEEIGRKGGKADRKRSRNSNS